MLIILDIRAAEDRGTEAAVAQDSYNTKLPTNINDDDFGPESTEPLKDTVGPTDITFCLSSAMASALIGYLTHPQVKLENGQVSQFTQSEDEMVKEAQKLETLFVDTADPSHLPSSLAAVTVRIIILKLWLSIQYPVQPTHAVARHRVSRESILRTATSVLELTEMCSTSWVVADRLGWWVDTYVQWHPLAVALAELCVQVEGESVERAWRIVDAVFAKGGELVADSKSGALWRPIRKLLKKAKAARAENQLRGLSLKETVTTSPSNEPPTSVPQVAGEPQQPSTTKFAEFRDIMLNPAMLQDYPNLDTFDFDLDIGTDQSSMDWSTWDEFVFDAQATGGF
jgi:hypothetical protein